MLELGVGCVRTCLNCCGSIVLVVVSDRVPIFLCSGKIGEFVTVLAGVDGIKCIKGFAMIDGGQAGEDIQLARINDHWWLCGIYILRRLCVVLVVSCSQWNGSAEWTMGVNNISSTLRKLYWVGRTDIACEQYLLH